MSYSEEYIKNKVTDELKTLHVEVVDQSDGCGAKFSIVVVSELFQGKPIVQRHRLVHGVLKEELKTIHAITITALTPEQWEKSKS
ncbi:protein BOLA2 [Nylanderia fulva]|uniref:protein BOLA2 n=1 Tax=Nylanderia fulva TaxID=613905 RepID=UPI0010FAEC61|nr:protein BOLA2 [Nylanderia fulva]